MTKEIEALKERLAQVEDRLDALERDIQSNGVTVNTGEMGEFVEDVAPTNHVERTIAIAHFLVHKADMDPFSFEEVEEGYLECRIPKPANMSDVLARAGKRGWLMKVDTEHDKQHWTITKDGEKAVSGGFES